VDVRLRLASEIDQRDDVKQQSVAEGLKTGLTQPGDLERAQKSPRLGFSKRLAEKLIAEYLDEEGAGMIDVKPDDLDMNVFRDVIGKHKARALADGRKADWVALHNLAAQVDELDDDANEQVNAPASDEPMPDGVS
jgi:hypothetical protein